MTSEEVAPVFRPGDSDCLGISELSQLTAGILGEEVGDDLGLKVL